MTTVLKVKKGPKVKRALKVILMCAILAGVMAAAFIGEDYLNCSCISRDFRRGYGIDPDKRINAIKEKINDIEKEDVKDTKNINRLGEQYSNLGGIYLKKSLWDQGLGKDMLRTLVGYGFDYLNLHRIYLRVFAANQRAVHAYEQVGFVHEGRFREVEWRRGQWQDLLYMSILRHEWQRA